MADRPTQLFAQEVARALSSLRASFDIVHINNIFAEKSEVLRYWYLKIEETRYKFNTGIKGKRTNVELLRAMQILRDDLRSTFNNSGFSSLALDLPYRHGAPSDGRPLLLDWELYDNKLTAADAVAFIIPALGREIERRDSANEPPALRLKNLLPEQRLAPVSFSVRAGMLTINRQHVSSGLDNTRDVAAAKSQLIAKGEEIIGHLALSNCDPRITQTVIEIQKKLGEDANIIQLGLLNTEYAAVCSSFYDELPEAVALKMTAHSMGIGMFVAQFPEWARFAEKAAQVAIEPADAITLAHAAELTAERLEADKSLSEPQVPMIIRHLAELVKDPATFSRRAVFAVFRTLENLVISVFRFGADVLEKTSAKTADSLSTTASKLASGALLGIAVGVALQVSPIAATIQGGEWMSRAIEIVKTWAPG